VPLDLRVLRLRLDRRGFRGLETVVTDLLDHRGFRRRVSLDHRAV
jgi:hypothetical protein